MIFFKSMTNSKFTRQTWKYLAKYMLDRYQKIVSNKNGSFTSQVLEELQLKVKSLATTYVLLYIWPDKPFFMNGKLGNHKLKKKHLPKWEVNSSMFWLSFVSFLTIRSQKASIHVKNKMKFPIPLLEYTEPVLKFALAGSVSLAGPTVRKLL